MEDGQEGLYIIISPMITITLVLKRFFVAFILSSFLLLNTVFAAGISEELFQEGVEQYRNGNAAECLDIMKKLNKQDPSNSYVVYYIAMSCAKSGNLDDAKKNYEKVILLGGDSQLVSYAKEGIKNIENAENAVDEEALPKKKFKTDAPPLKKEEAKADDAKKTVSDDEVANAIKVLRDAGLLNVQLGTATGGMGTQTNDLMNLNMMMGSMGGSKGSGMDMLPLLMMQQQQGQNSGKGISPEIIQMMMNNSMLDGLSTFDVSNKDK